MHLQILPAFMPLRLFICVCLLLLYAFVYADPWSDSLHLPEDSSSSTQAHSGIALSIERQTAVYDSLKHLSSRKALKAIRDAALMADQAYAGLTELRQRQISQWQRCEILLATAYYERGRYLDAEEHLDIAAGIAYPMANPENEQLYVAVHTKLDSVMDNMAFPRAKEWLRGAIPAREAGDKLDEVFQNWKTNAATKPDTAEVHVQTDSVALQSSERLAKLREEASTIERTARNSETKALLERYKALQAAIAEEEQKSALALLEKQNQLENQERELLLLEQDHALSLMTLEQERARNEAIRKTKPEHRIRFVGGAIPELGCALPEQDTIQQKTQSSRARPCPGERAHRFIAQPAGFR
jgi:hypothetical protein